MALCLVMLFLLGLIVAQDAPTTTAVQTRNITSSTPLPDTTALDPLIQSCVSSQISAVNCDQQNWGCYCDNTNWLSRISTCEQTVTQATSTSTIPWDFLSLVYCKDLTNLFTITVSTVVSTYTGPAVAITPMTVTLTSLPISRSTVFVLPSPTTMSLAETVALTTGSATATIAKSLSRKTIIGLSVGVPAGLLAVLGVVALLYVWVRRRRVESSGDDDNIGGIHKQASELITPANKVELEAPAQVVELPVTVRQVPPSMPPSNRTSVVAESTDGVLVLEDAPPLPVRSARASIVDEDG
ncbi:hypothetical protein BDV96DRAFT_646814 [Lophiotrema nucula]|uniref:Uncharacterized protein n=1 Tax=Lophiotrema nucula TaxID=690887 RepID=A0A6A5Z955_9PLEO|nr:hypothetical protein BDV96DRAFT_646814 [Lophiotrema nucula]